MLNLGLPLRSPSPVGADMHVVRINTDREHSDLPSFATARTRTRLLRQITRIEAEVCLAPTARGRQGKFVVDHKVKSMSSHDVLRTENITSVLVKPKTQNDGLVQRKQKTLGGRLAGKTTMHTTLCRRTGVDGIAKASTVRLKDVKVMQDGTHCDLLVIDDQTRNTSKPRIATDAVTGRLKTPTGNLVAVHVSSGHSKLNLFASTVGHHTKTSITCVGINLLKAETSRQIAHLGDENTTVGKPIKFFGAYSRHNNLQKRINHLESISHNHRMIRSALCTC